MTTSRGASSASALPAASGSSQARFTLGSIAATPGVLALLDQYGINLFDLIARHASGDWGDIDADDAHTNEAALIYGNRLLSCYTLAPGDGDSRVWIISEADRSVTTALMPSEY